MMKWLPGPVRALAFAVLFAHASAQAFGQSSGQSVGSVPAGEATVVNAGDAGLPSVARGRIAFSGNSAITAKERTAHVTLDRGGQVKLCQTSTLHVAQQAGNGIKSSAAGQPMMLALDRGAVEIAMAATTSDVLLTPDLRITLGSAGTLDLRMRVTRNGDTCVENRGRKAPVLNLTDAFGETSYQVKPGQHVLFERANLREVVDHETTPCGCPEETPAEVSIAEAMLHGGGTVTPKDAAAVHPFPASVSEGLAEPGPLPVEAQGKTHVQVTTTLNSASTAEKQAANAAAGGPAATAVPEGKKRTPLGAVGRFFKRIFVR